MTALMTPPRPRPRNAHPGTRRIRIDAPVAHSEVYPESLYLRRWAARQSAGYQDLLLTIAAVAKPARQV